MAGVSKIGQYVLGPTLGTGSFGKVKKAEHQVTGHAVAVKIISREKLKDPEIFSKLKREIQILKLFRHPHIIKLYQVISSPDDVFLIMEYVSGGELFDYIRKNGRLNELEARRLFQQLVSGVYYCHRHQVIHRDLKPENILLDSHMNVKIADFGLSNITMDGEYLRTSCGSPNYAAPEVVTGSVYAGPEIDVWSCGVILYVLLFAKLPFDDDKYPALFKKIKEGLYHIPYPISAAAEHLLGRMLCVNALNRASMEDIIAHEWFAVNMPAYLFPASSTQREDDPVLHRSIVAEISLLFRISESEVEESILRGDENDHVYIAFRLMQDNLAAEYNGGLTQDEAQMSTNLFSSSSPHYGHVARSSGVPSPTFGPPSTLPPLPPPLLPHQSPLTAETKRRGSEMGSDGRPPHQILLAPEAQVRTNFELKKVKKSRWHLGMRSQSAPEEIMAELYRAMKALNLQWKAVSPYHARCRCWNQVSGNMLKMSLQLFKIDDNNFLLDFQNLPTTGHDRLRIVGDDNEDDSSDYALHTLEFFELCAMLITELSHPSS